MTYEYIVWLFGLFKVTARASIKYETMKVQDIIKSHLRPICTYFSNPNQVLLSLNLMNLIVIIMVIMTIQVHYVHYVVL